MGFLVAAALLYLSLTDAIHCQVATNGQTHEYGLADIRGDIGSDHGTSEEYKYGKSTNDTKNAEEVFPYGKDRKAMRPDTANCSCAKELMALQEDLKLETNERLTLKASMDNFVSEVQNLQKMVYTNNSSKLIGAPNAIAAADRGFVAFSSKLSYNRELKPLDTVVFDTVLTNNGNPYNAETGMFTAPLSGIYMFQTTILSGYNTKVETAIIVNDKEVARIYSGAHDAHGSGSNMAIVELRSGDTVWVRLLYQGGSHVHGYYSTFSGALLRETD